MEIHDNIILVGEGCEKDLEELFSLLPTSSPWNSIISQSLISTVRKWIKPSISLQVVSEVVKGRRLKFQDMVGTHENLDEELACL